MTLLEQLESKVLFERLVIGLEEPVLVKGLGELQAKIDSGNGGYNVIHGTDFHQQGDVLMFTTHDSFGHEKKISAKIIDDIDVNMGGGNIEKRPVIELDIKFAGEDYKKIPFSVSDRSTNTNPILISKGFVENELEALIDVGAKNISNDGIDVVYGEGYGDNFRKIGKGADDAVRGVASGVSKTASGIKNGAKGLVKGAGSVLGGVTKGLGRIGSGIAKSGEWMKGGDNTSILDPIKGAINVGKDVAGGVVNGTKNVAGGLKDATKGTLQGGYDAAKGLISGGFNTMAGALGASAPIAGAAGGLASSVAGLGLLGAIGITTGGIKLISSLCKKISMGPNLTRGDAKEIKKRIASTSDWVKILQKLKATKGTILETERSVNPNKVKMLPIVSFSCQKGIIGSDKINWTGNIFGIENLPKAAKRKVYVAGQEGRAKSWKKEIETARKGIDYLKSQKSNPQETEQPTSEEQEEVLEEALKILPNNLILEAYSPENKEQQQQVQEESEKKQQEILTNFEDLSMFQLWFISTSTDDDSINYVCKKFIEEQSFDGDFSTLFENGKVTVDSVGNVVKTIVSKIKKLPTAIKSKLSGLWCVAISPNTEAPDERDYNFFQQEPYLIYTLDKELSIKNPDDTLKTKKIKEQVESNFNKLFPNIKNTIDGLENSITNNPDELIMKIIRGEAFQNEMSKSEDFPQFIATLNNFKKVVNDKLQNVNDDKKQEVIESLREPLKNILPPFAQEYSKYELSQSDTGSQLLDFIGNDGIMSSVENFNDLINIITNIKPAVQLLIKSVTEEQEEIWIRNKLDFFREKGIM